MSRHQTVAGAVNPYAWKDQLGLAKKIEAVSPAHTLGLVAGSPSCGKTHFFLSAPNALIINFDKGSISTNPEVSQAGVWPVINAKGETVDVDGKPFVLSWSRMQAICNSLVKSAEEQKARPDFVVFDTLAGMMALGISHLETKSGKLWKDMHGLQAWDELYQLILGLTYALRLRGFGVWFTCHVVDNVIRLGDNLFKENPELTIPPGLWKRLFWQFELSFVIRNGWDTETTTLSKPTGVKDSNGQEIVRHEKVTRRVRTYHLTAADEKYHAITKCRVPLGEFTIPTRNGWGAFEQAYFEAAEHQGQ